MQRVSRLAAHVGAAVASTPAPLGSPAGVAAEAASKVSGSNNGTRQIVVTIIGAGNSGHTCAALFEENTRGRVRTQLLTHRPNIFGGPLRVRFPDGTTQEGRLSKISDNPAELVPESDIVLWTGPVNATKSVMENIRPYLTRARLRLGLSLRRVSYT